MHALKPFSDNSNMFHLGVNLYWLYFFLFQFYIFSCSLYDEWFFCCNLDISYYVIRFCLCKLSVVAAFPWVFFQEKEDCFSLLLDGPLTVRWEVPLLSGGIGHFFLPGVASWHWGTSVCLAMGRALPPRTMTQGKGRSNVVLAAGWGGSPACTIPSNTHRSPGSRACYWSRWNEGQLPAWPTAVPSREGWAPVTASGRQNAATCLVLAGVNRGGATAVSVTLGSSREVIVSKISVSLSCPFLCPLSRRRGCYWGYFCLYPLAFSVPNLGHLKQKRNARTHHRVLLWPPRSPVDLLPFLYLRSLMLAFYNVQGVPPQPSWGRRAPCSFEGPQHSL